MILELGVASLTGWLNNILEYTVSHKLKFNIELLQSYFDFKYRYSPICRKMFTNVAVSVADSLQN